MDVGCTYPWSYCLICTVTVYEMELQLLIVVNDAKQLALRFDSSVSQAWNPIFLCAFSINNNFNHTSTFNQCSYTVTVRWVTARIATILYIKFLMAPTSVLILKCWPSIPWPPLYQRKPVLSNVNLSDSNNWLTVHNNNIYNYYY